MNNHPFPSRKNTYSVFYTNESNLMGSDSIDDSSKTLSLPGKNRLGEIKKHHSVDVHYESLVKFEGFVRKRIELLTGKKRPKDTNWHVQWTIIFGTSLQFFRVKYLNSAVSDEQPLPNKKPPIEALELVGQISLSGCHVGETPKEIREQKGAINNKIMTLALSDGSLYFLELANQSNVYNFLKAIRGEGATSPKLSQELAFDLTPLALDPETENLLEQVHERRLMLQRLEKMEEMFVGAHMDPSLKPELQSSDIDIQRGAAIILAPFTATLTEPYYLIPGVESTLVTPRDEVKVYGIMEDGRWRCEVEKDALYAFDEKDGKMATPQKDELSGKIYFPLIGSLPMSVIATCRIITSLQEL